MYIYIEREREKERERERERKREREREREKRDREKGKQAYRQTRKSVVVVRQRHELDEHQTVASSNQDSRKNMRRLRYQSSIETTEE